MEWDAIDAHWKQVCGALRAKWAGLTEADLEFIDRTKSALVTRVYERTGLARDAAERQLDALIAGLALGQAPAEAPTRPALVAVPALPPLAHAVPAPPRPPAS